MLVAVTGLLLLSPATRALAADRPAAPGAPSPDRIAADRVPADRLAADRVPADRLAADPVAAGRVPADPVAADRPTLPDGPSWLDRVREAAFAAARRPLDDPALDAARLEVRRAGLGRLPALRLGETGTLGWGGGYRFAVDAAVSVPLLAPEAAADRHLAALRLALTSRQLAAQRRSEVHDRLAQASALALTIRQLRILDGLAAALARDARRAGPNGAGSSDAGSSDATSSAASSSAARSSDAATGPPPDSASRRTRIEAALRVAGRSGLERQAAALRAELQRTLDVELPAPDEWAARRANALQPGARTPRPDGPKPDGPGPDTPGPRPLAFGASDLDPARCLAGSDAVALAQLARRDRRASAALRAARSATRVALELGGGIEVAGGGDVAGAEVPSGGLVPSARARLALSVRLPPWRPASGAATLAAGADGLEQSFDLGWPNRSPSALPDPTAGEDALVEVRRQVRQQLSDLTARELELRRRADLLARALALAAGATLADAALQADLALELAGVDHALALTALDAALLCGALPP